MKTTLTLAAGSAFMLLPSCDGQKTAPFGRTVIQPQGRPCRTAQSGGFPPGQSPFDETTARPVCVFRQKSLTEIKTDNITNNNIA